MNIDNLDTSRLMANPASPAAVARLQELRMEVAGKRIAPYRSAPDYVKWNVDRRFGHSPSWHYCAPRVKPWIEYIEETGRLSTRYRINLRYTRAYQLAYVGGRYNLDQLHSLMRTEQGIMHVCDYSSATAGLIAYWTRQFKIHGAVWPVALTVWLLIMMSAFSAGPVEFLAWLYVLFFVNSYRKQQRFHHLRDKDPSSDKVLLERQDLVLVPPGMKAAWNTAYNVLATGRSLSLPADVAWDKAWSNVEDFRAMRCVVELYELFDRMSESETIQDVRATIQDELTVIIEEVLRRHEAEVTEINDEVKNVLLSRRTAREVYGFPRTELPDPLDELDSYPDLGKEDPEQK